MAFALPPRDAAEMFSRLKSLMKKNLLRMLLPALLVGMALMSAHTVRAAARYGSPVFSGRQVSAATVSLCNIIRPNVHNTGRNDIFTAAITLPTRISARLTHGISGRGWETALRAVAHAGVDARAGADMRIKAADVQHSRPDRSVDRDLEDFIATLSGMQLVLLVLAIVLPVSVITPLLAVLLLGRRCDKCGRLRAMRDTAHSRHNDGVITKNGRRIYRYVVTRTCRHCGHTDSLEQARN